MKYGKKNEIKIDPLSYNLMLIGESGIGKTTVIKEYCEKLAGKDGYITLEIGKEDGADAIDGINYLTCPTWSQEYNEDDNTIGFATFIDDVVENKSTDFKDLRAIVVDTSDELFSTLAEPEVIRMHNRENPTKRTKTINSCFGGFGSGLDKAVEIVLDKLWSLKKVGVSFIIIGHTKNRTMTDAVTGEEYLQLTTNMSQKYFNALKTKVHFLGVASIDREIVKENTGKKNIVTGEKITKGVIKSEARKITFRDDNFSIDSKSRFSQISPSIPLDSDALVKAITDAIKAEQSKSGKSYEESKKEQEALDKEKEERIAKAEAKAKQDKELDSIKEEIVNFFVENKTNADVVKPILEKCRELGYANPKEILLLEDAKVILALTLK